MEKGGKNCSPAKQLCIKIGLGIAPMHLDVLVRGWRVNQTWPIYICQSTSIYNCLFQCYYWNTSLISPLFELQVEVFGFEYTELQTVMLWR